MTDFSRTERREFFRIKDRLLVEFRQVDYEESIALQEGLHRSGLLTESLEQIKPRHTNAVFVRDDVYEYLELMDRKLNTILDLLARRDGLFHSKYVDVVVSGSGIKYASDIRLDEGAFLELRIGLPFSPGQRIAVLGRVVRTIRRHNEDKDEWETAISFVAINEKDRDVLVNYIFSKERETLRARQKP